MPGPWLIAACVTLLGASGALATTASDICSPAANPCVVSTNKFAAPGSTLDFGTRQLDITGSGSLTIQSGLVTIRAGSVRLESHARLVGGVSADGSGANVSITTTGDVRVETGANGDAKLDMSATESPGEIDIVAGGDVVVLGQVNADGTATDGTGGVINITATGNTTISGQVSATGGTAGIGGEITIIAGGTASASGSVRADGGDGGDIEMDSNAGDVGATGTFNASADGTFGDGGSMTMLASRNLSLTGTVSLGGQGNTLDGGGDGGDADIETTTGSITLAGTIDNHGASPDGDAGETDISAGIDYTQFGALTATGNGTDGCGGFVEADVGRLFSMVGSADIDLSGGFCGGDVLVSAGAVTIPSTATIDCDGGDVAGSIEIVAGGDITAAGKLHAVGTGTQAPEGGFISLTGCNVSVPSGALVRTDGGNAKNVLQSSGQLTIGGTVQARTSGENRFEYLVPAKPPIILGTAVVQPTRDCAPAAGCLNPNLVACAAAAVCGNGIKEPGEDCDDGNATPCDGCSPSCHVEGCGNGTIECGEECDDGFANGAPGDPCDASCHVVQAANVVFIPGGKRGGNGCMIEWAIANVATGGFPSTTQTCIDGDPACDADGATDGVCTFHASACLNVTDARLPACHARAISYLKVRRPDPIRPDDATDASNAQQLVGALGGLGLTLRSGDTVLKSGSPDAQHDQCTTAFLQRVPHKPGVSGRRLLSVGATDVFDGRTSNRVKLQCLPNPAVCGNGVVEIGEQCDDGNVIDCDGCSSACKRERCGDAIVQCNEQCDDGASNGTPGDPCSSTCTEAPPTNRIPGGSSSRDCVGEYSLAAGQLLASTKGIPLTKQACVDGDPTCDFDPTPGQCTFHLWVCLGGADPRLDCTADGVTSLAIVRPTPTQTGPAAAALVALQGAVDRIAFPVGPGEVCSPRIDLDLPAGKTKLALKTEATSASGRRDRDGLKLTCAPAGTILKTR
jgi:cysteine-rich repeat protein